MFHWKPNLNMSFLITTSLISSNLERDFDEKPPNCTRTFPENVYVEVVFDQTQMQNIFRKEKFFGNNLRVSARYSIILTPLTLLTGIMIVSVFKLK